jgi:3-methyladenine DNA glycosylase AlkD
MKVSARAFDLEGFLGAFEEAVRAVEEPNTPRLRAVRKRFSRKLAEVAPEEVLALAFRLLESDMPAGRWFAYEFIHDHKPTLYRLDAAQLERLGEGMASWDQVDSFAPYLSGVAWRRGQIGDEVIHRWAASPDRWWRRAALVSTVALNIKARGGSGDVPRTLAVCDLLLDDRDDMVVKAMSWALRAASGHDPEAVTEYLDRYDERLAARVKREVRNKLETGLKSGSRK